VFGLVSALSIFVDVPALPFENAFRVSITATE
jgi:hypothetical protein